MSLILWYFLFNFILSNLLGERDAREPRAEGREERKRQGSPGGSLFLSLPSLSSLFPPTPCLSMLPPVILLPFPSCPPLAIGKLMFGGARTRGRKRPREGREHRKGWAKGRMGKENLFDGELVFLSSLVPSLSSSLPLADSFLLQRFLSHIPWNLWEGSGQEIRDKGGTEEEL